MSISKSEVTDLLVRWSEGDADALERLMPLVFDELRYLARCQFAGEPEEHTLQPTALVHEVYMRLVDQKQVRWNHRSEFFAFAATLMRRVLVDHAKARTAKKRGREVRKVPIEDSFDLPGVSAGTGIDLVALDRALEDLEAADPRQAQIVEMRFFAGLTMAEIAELLDVSISTVKREWRTARIWLYGALSGK